MLTPKERFELFLSYMKDRSSLTPEQIQGIEQRLENCDAYTSHYKPEDADRISNSNIFKDGQIKASVKPQFKFLSVENLECFLNRICFGFVPFRTTWLAQFREDIANELENEFDQLFLNWAFLKRKLLDFNLMRKDRNALKKRLIKPQKDEIVKELMILKQSVLLKIPNHKFPKGSIECLEEIEKDNVIDRLIYLFKTYIPQLKEAPMAHRISELLNAFDIPAKPGTIRQRMTRSKAKSE